MHSGEQKQEILKIAREAIYEYIRNENRIEPPAHDYLNELSGVFVTLHEDGELRGCIGFAEATHALGEALVRAAIYAATEDPRFPSVKEFELPLISIEVSVLSMPRQITDPSEIEIGRDGLILTLGRNRGLLLPQVPVEHNWDRDKFLKY